MNNIQFIDISKRKFLFITLKEDDLKELKVVERKIKKSNKAIVLSNNIKKKFKNFKDKKKLKRIENIIEFFDNNKIIYKDFLVEILNFIVVSQNKVPEEQAIYFLILENNNEINRRIIYMSNKYKEINIVTPNIKEFYNLEAENINVINNKRKSLVRANFIINIDFDEELLKSYFINRTATILNLSNNKILHLYNLDGMIINNVKLYQDDELYSIQDIYAVNKNNEILSKKIFEKIEGREVNFIGNNGPIILTK